MRPEIDALLARNGRAVSRDQALAVVTRNQLDDEIRRGHLRAPFARAYCRPWDDDDPLVLARAALASVGSPSALSHLTGLRHWGLLDEAPTRIHLIVPASRHPIGRQPGLTVHRTRVPTRTSVIQGLRVVEPAAAIVQSWPLLDVDSRRGPSIDAVRRRLVDPARLAQLCDCAVGLRGRGALRELITLLAAGCESELEIWGLLHVFDVPGLAHAVRQYRVRVGRQQFRLDLAYPDERIAVELDGERFHSTPEQREADRRRDAALAAIGWLTLRFSWRRLHEDIDGCRRDTLAALAARRAWRRRG